jgi:YfiH family protein
VSVSAAEFLSAEALAASRLAHAFFTRRGGVSTGVYASLNGGIGSRDDPQAVRGNRARMAAALGLAPDRLAIPYQVHSRDVATISSAFAPEARPRCDALVTATPGLGLGVTGADCGMVLLADREARVIGAAHAGWRGALAGVVEATVEAMARLGARPERIHAALGPCIAQRSYEVGPEFVAAFAAADADSARFFAPSLDPRRAMFDLNAYIAERARRAGVGIFEDLGLDTYADEDRFFSYRRATHRKEPDYGRLVAAIALA